jgi:type IV secretory pathway VirJ component
MNQLDVFNRIGGIIKELNEQYKYLESNPQKLNDLELELFVANAHFLADHAEILSKLQSRVIAEKPQEIAQKVDTKAENIVEEIKKVAPVTRGIIPEPVKAIEPPAKPVEPSIKPTEPKKSLIEKFFEPVVQQPKRDLQRGVELADSSKTDEPVPHIDLTAEAQKIATPL